MTDAAGATRQPAAPEADTDPTPAPEATTTNDKTFGFAVGIVIASTDLTGKGKLKAATTRHLEAGLATVDGDNRIEFRDGFYVVAGNAGKASVEVMRTKNAWYNTDIDGNTDELPNGLYDFLARCVKEQIEALEWQFDDANFDTAPDEETLGLVIVAPSAAFGCELSDRLGELAGGDVIRLWAAATLTEPTEAKGEDGKDEETPWTARSACAIQIREIVRLQDEKSWEEASSAAE